METTGRARVVPPDRRRRRRRPAERVARSGEWRTNVSLAGTLSEAHPDPAGVSLGAAAEAIGADLVGSTSLRRNRAIAVSGLRRHAWRNASSERLDRSTTHTIRVNT